MQLSIPKLNMQQNAETKSQKGSGTVVCIEKVNVRRSIDDWHRTLGYIVNLTV